MSRGEIKQREQFELAQIFVRFTNILIDRALAPKGLKPVFIYVAYTTSLQLQIRRCFNADIQGCHSA